MNAELSGKLRMAGGLWGGLVGDALGVPVEFQDRKARLADPVTGMRGYGTHHQPPGTWSDDGALLLCSVESLTEAGFNPEDMGRRFLQWHDHGHWTARGEVFDIGMATRKALMNLRRGVTAEAAGGFDRRSNGNGSLMRILPVVLASLEEPDPVFQSRLHRASAITHGHALSRMACVFLGLTIRGLMRGMPPPEAHARATREFAALHPSAPELGDFQKVLDPGLSLQPESKVDSDGYVLATLHASLWCLLTTGTFSDCVLRAVNLGWDTDTTGCVAGGLAGICYGLDAIPETWLRCLPRCRELEGLFRQFIHAFPWEAEMNKAGT